jgi:hypothetical protein
MRYDDRTKNKITALGNNIMADTNTAVIDGANYSHVQFFFMITTNAGERVSFKVQESDDQSTWTDISASTVGVIAGQTAALRTVLIDHKRYKRYLRGVSTIVLGLGTTTIHAIYCIQQNEKNSLGPAPDVSF